MKFKILLTVLMFAAVSSFFARVKNDESRSPEPPVLRFSIKAGPGAAAAPGEEKLLLNITIPDGYHIFGGDELKASLDTDKVRIKKIDLPTAEVEEGFKIYRGSVDAVILLDTLKGSHEQVEGNVILNWQGCQDFGDKVCFMPVSSKIPFALKIKAPEAAPAAGAEKAVTVPDASSSGKATAAHKEFSLFKNFKEKSRFSGFLSPRDFEKWFGGLSEDVHQDKGSLFSKAAKNNIPLAILIAILFGFLSSLTPCVYPVIPITIAYIGSRSSGKGRFSGFTLSLFFVLGLALVYSTLGVVSSLLGVSFGALTQKPVVGIAVAGIFLLLGLSMMGLFEISLPHGWTGKIESEKKKGKGYLGAFFIGALSGLVASPCIGPLLLAILVIVASVGSVVLGFVYLFAFALGMGILFIVIGTFSGILSSLPKSGNWMDFVKVIFGALILAASFYFGALYLSCRLFFLLSGTVLGFVSAFLMFGVSRHFFSLSLRIVGVILTVASFCAVLPFTTQLRDKEQGNGLFLSDLGLAVAKAEAEKKPLLLDFRADWCVACLELEKKTWPSKQAEKILADVVPVKIDFTKDTVFTRELKDHFQLKGLPTVILLDPAQPGGADGKDTGY